MGTNRNPSRKECGKRHALNRIYERYGINLSLDDIERMRDQIIAGEAVKLTAFGHGIIYKVQIALVDIAVFYDKRTRSITTALPPSALTNYTR
jgi:hypothetical protein